jgi:DNA-binding transcriptional MerR regulator
VTGNDDVAAQDAAAQTAAHEAAEVADQQGLLFDDDVSPLPSDTGYRGPTACNAAGITYRQLDYWARTGLVEPTVRGATGSGTQRLYSFRDILLLKVIKRLLDAGISLQQIRTAVQHLRERGTDDLTRVTLMSDGASVYECTSNDEVIDLLQGGQGVFGIAIGGVWREIEGTLAELPSERTAEQAAPSAGDELAARRAARQTG